MKKSNKEPQTGTVSIAHKGRKISPSPNNRRAHAPISVIRRIEEEDKKDLAGIRINNEVVKELKNELKQEINKISSFYEGKIQELVALNKANEESKNGEQNQEAKIKEELRAAQTLFSGRIEYLKNSRVITLADTDFLTSSYSAEIQKIATNNEVSLEEDFLKLEGIEGIRAKIAELTIKLNLHSRFEDYQQESYKSKREEANRKVIEGRGGLKKVEQIKPPRKKDGTKEEKIDLINLSEELISLIKQIEEKSGSDDYTDKLNKHRVIIENYQEDNLPKKGLKRFSRMIKNTFKSKAQKKSEINNLIEIKKDLSKTLENLKETELKMKKNKAGEICTFFESILINPKVKLKAYSILLHERGEIQKRKVSKNHLLSDEFLKKKNEIANFIERNYDNQDPKKLGSFIRELSFGRDGLYLLFEISKEYDIKLSHGFESIRNPYERINNGETFDEIFENKENKINMDLALEETGTGA